MQRRQTSVQGGPESLKAAAQHDSGTSQDTVSVERGQPKMRQTRGQLPAQHKQARIGSLSQRLSDNI